MNQFHYTKLLENKDEHKRFRVVVFGSARTKAGDAVYEQVYTLGKRIAEHGYDIVTGGGPGAMEAANLGHSSAANEHKVDSYGLNIKLPFEQSVNKGVEIAHEHERFSTRLDEFMSLANVVVVTQGGIGTLLELFYTWQLVQIKHMVHIPIILVGDMWEGLIKWMETDVLEKGMFSAEDMDIIYQVKNCEEAMDIIDAWHDAWKELGQESSYIFNVYANKTEHPAYKVLFEHQDHLDTK